MDSSKQAPPSEPVPPELPVQAKSAAPAHDIKLELSGGDRRVELRVTERAGEVRVAVRTPDPQLAGSLRENLPTLSSKLNDSGFRAEIWHPAAAATGWRHAAETGHGSLAQDSNSHQQGEGRQSGGGDPRKSKTPEEQTDRKKKGNDFAWLMSTLQ